MSMSRVVGVGGFLFALCAAPLCAQLSATQIDALEDRGQVEGWTFKVRPNEATERSLEELGGLVEPEDWRKDVPVAKPLAAMELPEAFDWRSLGACTPVRNQSSCGSCWAFATVGPLESAILIKDGISTDLSEQWLVNCNSDGFDCVGGWFAHDYHTWKTDSCGDTGAVYEADSPYMASVGSCECPYNHPYQLADWAYIGTNSSIPSVDAIKQAIYVHGPVSVAIYIDAAFQGYDEGIFNDSATGQVNHAVVLVGWDDTQGTEGVWILRNSWSPGWGEDGYMRIEYGCHMVGYAACYVDYPGQDPLQVGPMEDFVSIGEVGGPFVPVCEFYTLTNTGTTSLNWMAGGTESWLNVQPASGSLSPGQSDDVGVCIRNTADALPAGFYNDWVTFQNTTTGGGQSRAVTLRVGQPDYYTEQFSASDNDLDSLTLTLTPDGSSRYYRACTVQAVDFPTDPAGGTALTMSDDASVEVVLTGGAEVQLYGQSYPVFYVGSNGYITFALRDTDYSESLADHFDTPRISALFDDLNPSAGGTVSWKQLADRVAVTYEDVPEYGSTFGNSFQVEMFFNGKIRMTWLSIAAVDGVAGVSAGLGTPVDFEESDLSGYLCPASPTIVSAVSRIGHTSVGELDLDLMSPGGTFDVAVESREDEPRTVVVTFSEPVYGFEGLDPSDISLVSLAGSPATVSGVAVDDSSLTVQLADCSGRDRLILGFPGIIGVEGMPVEEELQFGLLVGDVDGSGVVNILDMLAVRLDLSQMADETNLRSDVDASGTVDVFDLLELRLHLDLTCPSPGS